MAEGGTLFLDEISEISPSVQAALLRVIEERKFRRVGGREKIKIDIRIIAASNANLEDLMKTGKFRQIYIIGCLFFPFPFTAQAAQTGYHPFSGRIFKNMDFFQKLNLRCGRVKNMLRPCRFIWKVSGHISFPGLHFLNQFSHFWGSLQKKCQLLWDNMKDASLRKQRITFMVRCGQNRVKTMACPWVFI